MSGVSGVSTVVRLLLRCVHINGIWSCNKHTPVHIYVSRYCSYCVYVFVVIILTA